uniref:Uncharacterized protein n=1 Tax=Sphaerodactylus townsendi TaxID=933632 RepID=A0ACB8F3J3_9SAUR
MGKSCRDSELLEERQDETIVDNLLQTAVHTILQYDIKEENLRALALENFHSFLTSSCLPPSCSITVSLPFLCFYFLLLFIHARHIFLPFLSHSVFSSCSHSSTCCSYLLQFLLPYFLLCRFHFLLFPIFFMFFPPLPASSSAPHPHCH